MKYIRVWVVLMMLFLVLPVAAREQPAAAESVYVIPIHGEIDRALMVFIRRSIQDAVAAEASTIIFEIDTFGGRVDSALQITTLIGSIGTAQTIAYIPANPAMTGVSWSAGALISFSCNAIYMAPGTSIGAAAPVYQSSEGMEMAPEKVVSAVRTQMASLAEKNGYSKAVALAMVDSDVELLEVYIDGERRLVNSEELPELEREARESGLTMETGKTFSRAGKLLSMTAGEMADYGISSGTPPDQEALLASLNLAGAEVVALEASVPDQIISVITGSVVTSLLVLIGLVALYMEITSPGFGIPGTIAIICFAIIFLGNSMLGTVASVELLLFLLGVVLLAVEIFLIPGFGVTGISGVVLIVFSLVLSRQDFIWPEFSWQWDQFRRNLLMVGIALLGSIALFALVLKIFPRSPLFKRLILTSVQSNQEGFVVQKQETADRLVGRRGVSVTALRPAGKAEIDEQVLPVETEGEFVEKGRDVEVVEASGNRIIVRRL
jgi:membrane-bound serine protease (ClpP class)